MAHIELELIFFKLYQIAYIHKWKILENDLPHSINLESVVFERVEKLSDMLQNEPFAVIQKCNLYKFCGLNQTKMSESFNHETSHENF